MPQALYILFGAGLTWVVSLALGRMVLRALKSPLYREEEYGLAYVTGGACLSLITFCLAAAHIFFKGTVLAVAAMALAAAWRYGAFRPSGNTLPELDRRLRWLYALPAALFFILTFFHAMAPEMSADGMTYHLGLVARYHREHGFSRLTTNMYGNLSQGIEMLFLYAFAFGRHSAAALVHFQFLIALVMMMVSYGRRFGFPAVGLGAAMIVFVSPVVGMDAASAYNDVATAAVVFAVFYLLQIWDETRSRGLPVAIGLLAGFAFACKYTAFLAVPYAAGFLLWRSWKKRGEAPGLTVRAAAAALGAATLMVAPWLVKNAIVVANPVSPFFNRIFPNPYIHISFEQEYAHHMRHYLGLASYWQIPAEVIYRGAVLCGLLGPLFLLAPLALLGLRNSMCRRLLFAACVFGSVYVTNIGTRFLLPAVPFVALAMSMVFARIPKLLPALVLAHVVSSWPPVIKLYSSPYSWTLDRILFKQALRIETEDGWLSRKSAQYIGTRMIEAKTPPGAVILSFNQVAEAYTTRDVLVVYQSALGAQLGGILLSPLIPESQPVRNLEFRFPPQMARAVRLRQVNGNVPDHWTICEVRLFDGARELERESKWRLTAKPNPWDVQDAFDNSPVTRWGSWERVWPGMHVDIDLGAATRLDHVTVETSPDVGKATMEVDLQGADGAWHTVSTQAVERETAPPLGLRREAAQVLRARGVGYILVLDHDFGVRDFAERAADWGITEVGSMAGYHLYRID